MIKNRKLTLVLWTITLLFFVSIFLPILQFSFNSHPVNLFGICKEFSARDIAGLRHFAPLGYLTSAILFLTVISQVFFLILVSKNQAKGVQTFSVVMTVVSLVAYIGFLLLVSGRSNFSLTITPFLLVAFGVSFIPLSGIVLKKI